MGMLSLTYGTFVAALAVIPNPWTGRIAFLFCGAVILAVGGMLFRAGTRESRYERRRRGLEVEAPKAAAGPASP